MENIILKLRLGEQYAIRISSLKQKRTFWTAYFGLLLIWTAVTLISAIAAGAVGAIIVEIVLMAAFGWLGYAIWKSSTSMIKRLEEKLEDLNTDPNG